ncbi:nucleotidyltransferase family protein [Tenacibaculum soleae]|uniref:nucleotidyltransferase family protein n=1 Tax=Tenacibaculum soleae TaxID=447689 RepID=UPI0023006E5E|nr:nucleotidyltransferase family protein [Tenacibaculum soleae]
MKKTAILILAAGKSSRMGSIKQLLSYKKTTLLGWAIKQAKQSKANAVFCVLGANSEIIKKSIENYLVEIIYNADYNNGLSTSIITGVSHLKDKNFDTVLIMLADQPSISTDYLNQLIITSEENNGKIIVSNYGNKMGVPALFPKQYFNKLINLKGDYGAKEFLKMYLSEIIKMPTFYLVDIDTKEDYKNLIK